ncbi:putative membrane protein [Murinocardiopsis flavida]|uniref:Putative membrane protein n=1 Tax=Murinocardiopsis flavida TaxID=645275 RepID=A0A2P8DNQ0_9ACTN|nr:DUF998 domain-containing protein [Murinocardiopsis flavida]PSK98813.1 putative membrane protein [Murinocardiopsis flavida]
MTTLQTGVRSVPKFPLATTPRIMVAATCWILCLGFFVIEAIVQSAWTTPYSMVDNYISDLGATECGTVTIKNYQEYVCSPLHALMNGAYIGVGVLAILGAALGRAAWPKGGLATTGLVLVALAGVGAIIAGVYPENVDLDLHLLGAVIAIPMSNIGMGLLALALRRTNPVLSAFTGAAVLIGLTGLVFVAMAPDSGIGLVERLAGYPFEIWKVVIGLAVLTAWIRRS